MAKQADQFGDAYLPGTRTALYRYRQLSSNEEGGFVDKPAANAERVCSEALGRLARRHATIKQGRAYLNQRADDPQLAIPTDTTIAAWLGHAWQLGHRPGQDP